MTNMDEILSFEISTKSKNYEQFCFLIFHVDYKFVVKNIKIIVLKKFSHVIVVFEEILLFFQNQFRIFEQVFFFEKVKFLNKKFSSMNAYHNFF